MASRFQRSAFTPLSPLISFHVSALSPLFVSLPSLTSLQIWRLVHWIHHAANGAFQIQCRNLPTATRSKASTRRLLVRTNQFWIQTLHRYAPLMPLDNLPQQKFQTVTIACRVPDILFDFSARHNMIEPRQKHIVLSVRETLLSCLHSHS